MELLFHFQQTCIHCGGGDLQVWKIRRVQGAAIFSRRTQDGVAGPCCRHVAALNAFPSQQILHRAARQRNGAPGIGGFGGVEHDLGAAAAVLVIFSQPADGPAYPQGGGVQVDVLLLQGQQLAQPQPGAERQPDKRAVPVAVSCHDVLAGGGERGANLTPEGG